MVREGEPSDEFYLVRHGAVALELTRLLGVNAKCLRDKCEADHDLGYELMKRFVGAIGEKLHAARLQALDIYGNSAA
jgi:CRP/FNR family transcriptional regulator, cyclic AMP receptor protein